jgi:glutathione S-transferase
MQLIYAKGACSFSVHLMLEEIGKRYETLQVSLKDKTVLEQYNEKSYVPALILDDGSLLTEAISILQYLADINHRSDLLADVGIAKVLQKNILNK